MKRENIFLTDTRRDVLDGDADLSAGSLANEKSRIRTRTRAAVDELIEVGGSEEIENSDVFNPEKIGTLLFWILNDPADLERAGGLHQPVDDVPEGAIVGMSDDFRQYRQQVAGEVAPSIMSIRNPDRGRFNG